VLASYRDNDNHSYVDLPSASSSGIIADASVVTLSTTAEMVTFTDNLAHSVNATIGTNGTLSSGDQIVGGAGADTIVLTGAGVAALTGFNFTFGGNQVTGAEFDIRGFENVDASGYTGTTGLTLVGTTGTTTLKGGAGNDTISYNNNVGSTIDGGVGTDTLVIVGAVPGAAGSFTVNLSNSVDQTSASGSTERATVTGFENVNASQATGPVVLIGSAGVNTLIGGAAADTITGGGGADQLWGGLGADTFRFLTTADSNSSGFDSIRDFTRGEADRIDLSGIDAIAGGGDNAFSFAGNFADDPARFVQGQLYFNTTTKLLKADVDGDGIADLVIEVLGMNGMQASDFIL
jgi:Ca2+-binding RTX toxin-like protein